MGWFTVLGAGRRRSGRTALAMLVTGVVSGLAAGLLAAPAASAQLPPVPPGLERVLAAMLPAERIGPGVTHRDVLTTAAAGQVLGDVVEVDLLDPAVRTDLLTPGAVAARESVERMAGGRGAVAAVNGDYFDLGGTGAAAGPAVVSGQPQKAAVPLGRRAAPAVPGAETDYVFRVGTDRLAAIDRLALDARVIGPRGAIPVTALNQYAIPVGGVGLFTPAWGSAGRVSPTCGSDTDPDAPCAAETTEVVVRDGVVAGVYSRPGGGPVAPDEAVLVGREAGAAALRTLRIGDRVQVPHRLVARSGVPPQFAVGGSPIVYDGRPVPGLDDRERAPRSAVGNSPDGRRMVLITVDGRQSDSVGATLAEFAALLAELGVDDAVNLDGGGSSTMVYRAPGQPSAMIVNDPSDTSPRLVPNAIGVFTG